MDGVRQVFDTEYTSHPHQCLIPSIRNNTIVVSYCSKLSANYYPNGTEFEYCPDLFSGMALTELTKDVTARAEEEMSKSDKEAIHDIRYDPIALAGVDLMTVLSKCTFNLHPQEVDDLGLNPKYTRFDGQDAKTAFAHRVKLRNLKDEMLSDIGRDAHVVVPPDDDFMRMSHDIVEVYGAFMNKHGNDRDAVTTVTALGISRKAKAVPCLLYIHASIKRLVSACSRINMAFWIGETFSYILVCAALYMMITPNTDYEDSDRYILATIAQSISLQTHKASEFGVLIPLAIKIAEYLFE